MKIYLKIFLLIFSITCNSQNNSLAGEISDGLENLSYVNIYIQNTKLGTSSNEDGYYQIKNIPSGTYKIVVSSLGTPPTLPCSLSALRSIMSYWF